MAIAANINRKESRTGVILALTAVYLSWGSTYLVIRIALEELPPLFMMGIRFFLVGVGLYIFLRLRGAPAPNSVQWRNAALIGIFLFLGGSGGIAYAEQWVPSGLAALVIATTPLWTVLCAGIWSEWPTRHEWVGLLLGLVGIVLLNFEGDLRASPLGAVALLVSAASWAFGSAWSRQLELPKGQMTGAVQMIAGGAVTLLASAAMGERIAGIPTWKSIGAVIYLAIFGSLVGFSAYMYLLNRVRPALATSYAYVNPVFAVALGVWFAGEKITLLGIIAMLVIIAGVILVAGIQRRL
jgi:drug/metabolite transporter (DMT)-like permease